MGIFQQTIGTWTGLLEHSLTWLVTLQKEYEQFPVMSRTTFADLLRSHVNILASDDHIKELLQQLHLMGEVSIFICNFQNSFKTSFFGENS